MGGIILVPEIPDWGDEPFHFYDRVTVETCTVFEEEEPEAIRSSILGPDGKPIFYEYHSERMPFIGFIDPDMIEAIREAQQRPKRKRRSKKDAGTG